MGSGANSFHNRMDVLGNKLREKEIRIPINMTAGAVFFILAIVILAIMPQQVAVSEKDVINGRAFPSLLMWIMMLCSGLLVLKDVYKIVKKQPLEWKIINLQTEAKALVIFGILFITYMLSKLTGLFVIGALRASGLSCISGVQNAAIICDYAGTDCMIWGSIPLCAEC